LCENNHFNPRHTMMGLDCHMFIRPYILQNARHSDVNRKVRFRNRSSVNRYMVVAKA